MRQLFEYSDILHSPIEAFYCRFDYKDSPVESHWHYFIEILYMLEGTAVVTCNDASFLLETGDFIILPPQAMHSIYHYDEKPFCYACVKFNLNRIQLNGSYLPNLNFAFHKIASIEDPPVLFHPADIPDIDFHGFFTGIVQEVQEHRYGYNAYVYSLFSMLILKVLRLWHTLGISFEPEKISEREEQTIQNILVYIDEHSQENINIEDLAHTYNMSYSYFAKLFRKQYGQSCKQYIEFVRLSKVENLLRFTDFDLNYIAAEAGFADCSHLIRTFKKRYEITPKQFRLKHQTAPHA